MATRSTISIKNPDGSFEQVYSHWDGYPSNNGFLLLVHYQDLEKIKKLLSFGDISSLREEVDIPKGKTHNFEKSLDNVTVFYGRDRNETPEEPSKFKNLKDFAKNGNFQEYDYVYDITKKQWFLFKPDLSNAPEAFEPLVEVVKRSYDDMQEEYKEQFDEFLKKPFLEAYNSLKEELSLCEVGVPKKPKKPLSSDHPQMTLDGIGEGVVEGPKKKKMKV